MSDKPLPPEEIAKMIAEQVKNTRILSDYSARDLMTALNNISKADLKQCLDPDDDLNEYWDNLVKADEALQHFFAVDLVRIIELNQLKQHER